MSIAIYLVCGLTLFAIGAALGYAILVGFVFLDQLTNGALRPIFFVVAPFVSIFISAVLAPKSKPLDEDQKMQFAARSIIAVGVIIGVIGSFIGRFLFD